MLVHTLLVIIAVMSGPVGINKDRQLLQRVQVIEDDLYSISYDIANSSPDTKAIHVTLRKRFTNAATKQLDNDRVLGFELSHHNSRAKSVTSKLNLPWTIHDEKLYITRNATHGPPASAWLINFSLNEKEPRKSQPLYDNGNILLQPVVNALSGFWVNDDGQSIMLRSIPHVDFDLYFASNGVLNLYVTVNSGLTYWTYDNKEWKYIRKYDFKVEGPFFVTDNGNSIVLQREGKWCVISGIESDETTIEPIAVVQKDVPLILIEDVTAKKQYLDLDGRVFDMKGMEIEHYPDLKNFDDRAEVLFDFIIKQRE